MSGQYEDRWFIEVDLDTESPNKIIDKCERYHKYYRSGLEQQESGVFPLTVWIVPSAERKKCTFAEYRNGVIINLLLNNGCRAATIRNIQIKDVDIENKVIYLRHTKNKRAQVIPLCEALCGILREYMRVRGGGGDEYLFPNKNGVQLTENGLRCTISKYNRRRGVEKTSIHLFRHTFAKKYLVDCGGNAFTLQRLLGHSTLDMTKHYCTIFDADITKNYDSFSPLTQIKGAEGNKTKMGR